MAKFPDGMLINVCFSCGIYVQNDVAPVYKGLFVCSDPVCQQAIERMRQPDEEQGIYTPDGIYDEYSGKTYV